MSPLESLKNDNLMFILPIINEVNTVIEKAVNDGRDQLNDTEIEYIKKITKRLVNESVRTLRKARP